MALSKFILGKNELKKNSIESKLLEAINNLHERREKYKHDDNNDGPQSIEYKGLELGPYAFYNEIIWAEVKDLMGGKDIPGKSESFYSVEYGAITHKRITGLYKSKLKADAFRNRNGRGLKFSKDVLDKLGLYYDVPDEIVIQDVTQVTYVTHYSTKQGSNNDISEDEGTRDHVQIDKVEGNLGENNDVKETLTPPKCVTHVTSVIDMYTDIKPPPRPSGFTS